MKLLPEDTPLVDAKKSIKLKYATPELIVISQKNVNGKASFAPGEGTVFSYGPS